MTKVQVSVRPWNRRLDITTTEDSTSNRVKRLMEEPLDYVLERLQNEGMSAEQAQLAVREYKKFISLKLFTKEAISPCKLVDEAWHAAILFTREYMDFCDRHFGRYIHHKPHRNGEKYPEVFERTLAFLQEHFLDYDREVWQVQAYSGCTDKCNSCRD